MKGHSYNFFVNSIPFVAALLPSVFAIPIYLQALGTYQLGVYYLYISIVGIGAAFDLGISQTIVKYVAEYKNKSATYLNYIILSSSVVLVILLLVFFILFLFLYMLDLFVGFDIPKISFPIFFVGLSLQVVLNFDLSILKGYEKFKKIAIVETFHKACFTILGLTSCIWWANVNIILCIHIGVTICVLAWIKVYFVELKYSIIPKSFKKELTFFKRVLFSYSKWVFLQNLIGYLNTNIDKFIVSSFVSIKALASYNTAQNLTGVFQGFVSKGLSYVLPFASQINERESLRKFFIKGNIVLSIGLGLVYIAGSFLSTPVIFWYLKDSTIAQEVTLYFDVLFITSLFSCTALLSWHLFNGMGEIKYNTQIPFFFNLVGIIIVVVSGLLYGVWGVLYAKLFGVISSIIVRTLTYNKIFYKKDYVIGLKLALPLILSIVIVKILKMI